MTTTKFTCSGCGGPLTAPPGAGHVDCPFCGVTNAIASEGAVKVAKVLEHHGIRMPERPISRDQIREELAERHAQQEATRRTALIGAVVFATLVAIAIGALLFIGR
jgi:LSD1 subclass zinc finger protein